MGNFVEGKADFDQAISLQPDNVDFKEALAQCEKDLK